MIRAAVAAFVLAAATGVAAARADCMVGKVMTLPVTMVGAQPSVEVKLDSTTVRLEVDSGAFFSTLSPATAAQLALKPYPAPFGLRVIGIGGEVADTQVVKMKTFGFGGATVPNVEFLVGGGSLQGAMGIVGVLGRNVLTFADTEYDFARGEVNLLQPRGCGGRSLAYWSATFSELPMVSRRPGDTSATALVRINGHDLRATFDTGANSTTLTLAGARRAGLDVHGPGAQPAGATVGVGRRVAQSWLVPVSEVGIGGEVIRNTKVRVADTTLGDTEMLVGADFFLSHRVYVANSQRKIYFTYNGGPVFDLSVKPNAPPPPEPSATLAAAAPPAGAGATPANSAPPSADEPKDADAYSRRGQAFAARHDNARALADLSRAVELDPQNPRYLRERAQLRLATRQPFLAMADLDAMLKLTPDDAEAHLMRARLRASGRDRAGEEADLEAADRAAPKQADLRLGLASAYTALDRNDQAVTEYDQWLSFHDGDPRKAVALNGRCWARARAGRELDQALRDCDAALRLAPKTAAFLDSRGLVQLKRGALDQAQADYEAALAIQPKSPLALYARGVIKTRKGDAAGGQADIAAATAANAQVTEMAHRAGIAP